MSQLFTIPESGGGDLNMLSALAQRPLPNEQDVSASVRGGFDDAMRQAGEATEQVDELREAAEQFVSTAMIMPLFQQLRDDPLATPMFHGGRAEHIFQQQMDQILSDRMAGATNFDIVDAVYNQLRATAGGVIANG